MQTTSVTQSSVPATQATLPTTKAPAASAPPQLTPANVTGAVLKRAVGDGDGRTGIAALNDGDAAAQAARLQAFDVKA